nr:uncharacterized protein LOC111516362 [Leptinotarsa decemlineata]
MGISTSKSHLERRNTVARRSQRRTIHGLKSKVDKVIQDIKRFRETEEHEKYAELMQELNQIRNNLEKRKNDLQPQVRNIYQTTWNKLEEAYQALDDKVFENHEKARMKESEQHEKQKQKESKSKKKKSGTKFEEEDDIEITEDQEDNSYEEYGVNEFNEKYEEHEKSQLANSSEKRQTVELKFVQVIPETTVEADVHSEVSSPKMKSAEEKRKSILKMGVPVLPGVVMPNKKISIVSPEDAPHPSNGNSTLLDRITDINEQLEAIEYQIADFVGKKNGTQYNRIKNTLTSYYHEISDMKTNDSFNLDQIRLCKNYIGSCLNFLDEKSVDVIEVVEEKKGAQTEDIANEDTHQDDVFLSVQNNGLSQQEVSLKLQKLTKTTAI